ncbi:FadR/GntR family transcriptional regulator [Sporichthya polymorpha]|uniref:FadR/GntR family transcriptional regulator n=1 Tax=Sporichthya polymorpha TaxID=35751 RepID=UPI0003697477|nr:FCD domain-containing protein [Sporichthya polymorpha]
MSQDFPDLGADPMRVPKVAELVAQDLRRRIASGAFAESGELPPGTVLMQAYGVSRPTLREAYRILESENLVEVGRGGHDAFVRQPSIKVAGRYAGVHLQMRGTTLLDVERARAVVEPPAAGMLAARGGDPEVRKALQEALQRERDSLDDPAAFSHASFAFHDLVVELSGNVTLHAVFGVLGDVVQRHTDVRVAEETQVSPAATDRAALMKGHRAHVRFVEHVEAEDVAAATALWRTHVEAVSHALGSDTDPRGVVDLF